jgi:hypothetical protein
VLPEAARVELEPREARVERLDEGGTESRVCLLASRRRRRRHCRCCGVAPSVAVAAGAVVSENTQHIVAELGEGCVGFVRHRCQVAWDVSLGYWGHERGRDIMGGLLMLAQADRPHRFRAFRHCKIKSNAR